MTRLLALLLFITGPVSAQTLTQRVRGTVTDPVLQKPIPSATVTLVGENRSVLTDTNGYFSFSGVPLGQHQLRVTHVGFREASDDNLVVEAGRETVLTITLDILPREEQEVVIKADPRKNKPLNEMSLVSARTFSVEETQKYAASVEDPLRMALSFAGVMAPMDGNNDIVIRGNSPVGLLWRMEGVDIPNPNHFANTASSGGGISILSAQLLANSDFLTSAFPAEYGDALSGVFDLHLRKGNDEKHEFSLQAGFLGVEASAEGPMAKGSYLVNYRYSTLSLLGAMGVDLPNGTINYSDLSYNLFFPTKKAGDFSLFGFGGLSTQRTTPKLDSTQWKNQPDRYAERFDGPTGMTGLTHTLHFGARTSLHSVLAYSYTESKLTEDYVEDDYAYERVYSANDQTPKWTLTSTLNHRFGNGNILRAGYSADLIGFNYNQQARKDPGAPLLVQVDASGHVQTVQAFAQWQGRPAPHLLVNAGLHYLELLYNHTWAVEPRASLQWDVSPRTSLSLGYGLHSQIQPLGVYFGQDTTATGAYYRPNSNLGLTRAHHFVLSYNQRLAHDLHFKAELYFQRLFNVPVNAADTNTFSTLNIESSDYVSDPLVNKGSGQNYGLELTLEKYLSHHVYYMVNGSLYQSQYRALDGVLRNTRFNGHYIVNFTGGKDWVQGTHTWGANLRTLWAGGYWNTPVDTLQSSLQGTTIYKQQLAYTQQNPAYFRTDLRVSYTKNQKHHTTTLSLDLQNVTNQKNVYDVEYDQVRKKVVTVYQTGLIPVLNYKIEF
ncbi:TonB-dependent receptor [Dinghuibacter silviterrae]|uniref:Outer membrane receptor protein involved in Fe transport n=1 Tax=Dinghuibacter silviterrae TaxID=1539049 RepID=A0A4R8DGZ5_9BACT|nr:TonB-dependent receptor [Dinghuibacter silviterrae]TDW96959.1 outer membrane receptor protein involved in Fe transport [Dinghuibacter silviterrae]